MPLELSPGLQRALAAARAAAHGRSAAVVEPLDLLCGLLAEPEGRAAELLRRAGLDPTAWAGAPGAATDLPEMPFSPATRDLLQRARDWAAGFSAVDAVTTDQVLFTLLRHAGELRVELQVQGLLFERLEAEMLAGHGPPLRPEEPLQLGDEPAGGAGTGAERRQRLAEAQLYVLVTQSLCRASLEWTIFEAAAGGAQVVQLREKGRTDRELLALARQVRCWTRQAGVLFIMNDRPDLAVLADADGVHVGQEELPVAEARSIVGHQRLIGVSTHDLDQVQQAVLGGADCIGVGPTFPSGTKSFADLPGLEFVRQALMQTALPVFVIGGVNLDSIDRAVAAGARRVAVSQAICQAADPRTAAVELRRRLGR